MDITNLKTLIRCRSGSPTPPTTPAVCGKFSRRLTVTVERLKSLDILLLKKVGIGVSNGQTGFTQERLPRGSILIKGLIKLKTVLDEVIRDCGCSLT